MKKILLIVLLLSFGFSQQIIHTETYENGNIESITYYKETQNGIEKVKYKEYDKNEKKRSEGKYKDGDRDELWIFWYGMMGKFGYD